jgi:hypothetical protein
MYTLVGNVIKIEVKMISRRSIFLIGKCFQVVFHFGVSPTDVYSISLNQYCGCTNACEILSFTKKLSPHLQSIEVRVNLLQMKGCLSFIWFLHTVQTVYLRSLFI